MVTMAVAIACRVCLSIGVKMFPILNTNLQLCYEAITGLAMELRDGRPHHACFECAARLRACQHFRNMCLRADSVMSEMLDHKILVNEASIRVIDRSKYNLTSSIERSTPQHCIDIHFYDEIEVKVETTQAVVEEYVPSETEQAYEDDQVDTHEESDDDVPLKDISSRKVDVICDDAEGKREVSKRLQSRKSIRTRRVTRPKDSVVAEDDCEVRKRGFNEDYATEILLTKEQQMAELNQRSATINYLNSPFKCVHCFKGFVDDSAYKNHLGKHDKSSGEFECEICQMRYGSVRRLRAHVISSHSRMYACKSCSHRSHTANQAREHEKWHKGFLYECQLCGENFRKSTSHLTHMRKRHPTEFVCDVCGDSFVGRHGLMMHKRKTHKISHDEDMSKAKTLSVDTAPERYCRECNMQFLSVGAWKRHMVTSAKHALTNDFGNGCRVCGEKFTSREMLTAHHKVHVKRAPRPGDADFQSDFTITRIDCDQCGAQFVTRSKCLAHVRRVHLGVRYNKNIVCEVCGKKCTSNATLKYHQRTHTGEKPYACSDCPKRFSDRNQLRIHTRTHTDERPYCCSLCAKTFRQKPALNRHLRVHTGAKPYECHYCTKTFSQSNSLKLHVHTVHLKLPPMYRNRSKPPRPDPPKEPGTLQPL